MKGSMLRLSAAALAGVLFAAVTAQADMMTKVGPGEGEVDIVAWPGYIERGANDKNYDWVTDFEKQTGCKVNVKTAGTSDEMVSLMNGGGFDLVTASGDATRAPHRRQHGAGDQHRADPELEARSTRGCRTAPGTRSDGQHYGVPYQWGPNVLMYNTKVFKDPPKSWNVVFEEMNLPDGKSNKGRVQAYYGPIYIADAALYLKAHRPELGITDPYELDQKQFDAAVELLHGQRQIVQKYWSDATAQIEDFTNEGVVASTSWPYQVNLLRDSNKQPDRQRDPGGRRHRLGRHHHDACPGAASELRLYVARAFARSRSCRAISPPGSAACRWCRRPARATRCSATAAARPTASRTSTRSASGRRRSPIAATAGPACPTRTGRAPIRAIQSGQ